MIGWLKKLFSKPDELAAIRKAFKEYFGGKVQLPRKILSKSLDNYSENGWFYSYVLSTDEHGLPRLDFTAEHRMTNSRHVSIAYDGEMTHLESYQEGYSYDDDIPGDKQQSEQEYYAHNRRISQMLIEKGLLAPDNEDDHDDDEEK